MGVYVGSMQCPPCNAFKPRLISVRVPPSLDVQLLTSCCRSTKNSWATSCLIVKTGMMLFYATKLPPAPIVISQCDPYKSTTPPCFRKRSPAHQPWIRLLQCPRFTELSCSTCSRAKNQTLNARAMPMPISLKFAPERRTRSFAG